RMSKPVPAANVTFGTKILVRIDSTEPLMNDCRNSSLFGFCAATGLSGATASAAPTAREDIQAFGIVGISDRGKGAPTVRRPGDLVKKMPGGESNKQRRRNVERARVSRR